MLVSQQRNHLLLFCFSSYWMAQVSSLFTVFLRNASCPAITFCSSLRMHSRNSLQARVLQGGSTVSSPAQPLLTVNHAPPPHPRWLSAIILHPLTPRGTRTSPLGGSPSLKPFWVLRSRQVCLHLRASALAVSSAGKLLPHEILGIPMSTLVTSQGQLS